MAPTPRESIVASSEPVTFADLEEPVQQAAKWIADYYIAHDRWPNQVEFARFCFGVAISLDQIRNTNWHDVFDSSIGFSTPREQEPARVKPWIFYDLGLAPEAFRVGVDCFISTVNRLFAGPELMVTIDDQALPASVPTPLRRLVGHLMLERHGGSPPDAAGKWSVIIEMNEVKRPLPDLTKFVKRPERRRVAAVDTLQFQRGQKPTLWAFVSSTYEDLKQHRQATQDAALRLKVLPLGMELWTASPKPALRYCLDELAEADLMILIVGTRYGSVTDDGRSYTEAEYDQARKLNIPIYVFLPGNNPKPEGDHAKRLQRFVARLQDESKVAYYESVDDLRSKVIHALSNAKAGSRTVEQKL